MKCNQCKATDTKVIESRESADGRAIRRRRECSTCGQRFTTYERLEQPQLIVIKNDATRQLFSRDKLLAGLYRACEKTSVSSLQLDEMVDDIERQLQSRGEQEVASREIGDMVMSSLAELNEVAYVRFASVYRRFKDIASFEKELIGIKKRAKDLN
jgi:transcriptional repressor NrdR